MPMSHCRGQRDVSGFRRSHISLLLGATASACSALYDFDSFKVQSQDADAAGTDAAGLDAAVADAPACLEPCVAPTRICDAEKGKCVACTSDTHCEDEKPRCDKEKSECVECLGHSDCPRAEASQ